MRRWLQLRKMKLLYLIFITSIVFSCIEKNNEISFQERRQKEDSLNLIKNTKLLQAKKTSSKQGSKFKELDLSFIELDSFPKEFIKQNEIELLSLNTSSNFNDFELLENFKNLKILMLQYCELDSIPPQVYNLNNLEELYLTRNNIKSIDSEIQNLSKLRILWIANNKIENLPSEIANLNELEELKLGLNKITKYPDVISKLKKLRVLALNMNDIIRIPKSISNLENLRELNLTYSWLVQTDKELKQLLPNCPKIYVSLDPAK